MRLFNLFAGQRAVGHAIHQLERHGLLALAHALLVTIHVEKRCALQHLARRRRHALHQTLARHVFIHHERHIHGNGRERRNVHVIARRTGRLQQRIQVKLERNHGSFGIERLNGQRMNLAQPAQHRAACHDFRRAARLQMRRFISGKRLETQLGNGQLTANVFHNALAIEEIERHRLVVPLLVAKRACKNARNFRALLRLLAAFRSRKHHAHLVELHVLHATILVVGNRAQKPRNNALAHNALIHAHGVDKLNRLAQAKLLCVHAQLLKVFRVGERIRHGFVHATGTQGIVQQCGALLVCGFNGKATTTARQRGRNQIHAVQAQHFFIQVNLALKVRTEAGRHHVQNVFVIGRRNGAAQKLQGLPREFARNVGAHHAPETLNAEDVMERLAYARPFVDDALVVGACMHHMSACNFHNERCRSSRTNVNVVVVNATLIAHRAFADQTQVAARTARATCLERCRFQQDVGGFLGHFGIKATHNARQRNSAVLGRGDNRHISRELTVGAIKRYQVLAFFCRTDNHSGMTLLVLQFCQVKRMKRLTEQEQDIIRHVHHVVDGALANGSKTLNHPVGAGAHLHAANDARRVTRATLLILDRNAHQVLKCFAGVIEPQLIGHFMNWIRVTRAIHCAHFARKTHHGKAVRAIRRNLQVKHGIGLLQVIGNGHAHGCVFGKHPNARMVGAKAQLTLRAAHAVRRHAAQLAFLDFHITRQMGAHARNGNFDTSGNIGRAAHDLQRLALRDIHRYHVHMVAIGVIFAGQNVANHHVIESGTELFHAFYARARQIQAVAKRLSVRRNVHVIGKPLQRYLHVLSFVFETTQPCATPEAAPNETIRLPHSYAATTHNKPIYVTIYCTAFALHSGKNLAAYTPCLFARGAQAP